MPLVDEILLQRAFCRDFLFDLEDGLRAEAHRAHRVVRDHTELNAKRARESEGQLRFRMMEQRFEEVAGAHGWVLLEGGVIPSSEFKVFQPFVRKVIDGRGIVVGLAAMTAPATLPPKNKSRSAGVSLNFWLTPGFDFDGSGVRHGDVFVLLLVARDRDKAGQLEELAIGIVDSTYVSFLFYQTTERFLSVPAAEIAEDSSVVTPAPIAGLSLKREPAPFRAPEDEQPAYQEPKTG